MEEYEMENVSFPVRNRDRSQDRMNFYECDGRLFIDGPRIKRLSPITERAPSVRRIIDWIIGGAIGMLAFTLIEIIKALTG